MNRNIAFRRATIEDTSTIVQFGADTFKSAFAAYQKPEDMESYLATNFNDENIRSQISDASTYFLLGYEGKNVIGYAMLRKGVHPECVTGPNPIELVRFYVSPNVIGRGYGSELMRHSLGEAQKMGHKTIWLSTWQKNDRANRFYEKWGFEIVGNAIYVIGEDVVDDFIMQWSE